MVQCRSSLFKTLVRCDFPGAKAAAMRARWETDLLAGAFMVMLMVVPDDAWLIESASTVFATSEG
jgi:hypothetical protein